jgi:hypothetical protein
MMLRGSSTTSTTLPTDRPFSCGGAFSRPASGLPSDMGKQRAAAVALDPALCALAGASLAGGAAAAAWLIAIRWRSWLVI